MTNTLPNPTVAYFNPGGSSYGPRLFLPAGHVFWGDSALAEKSNAAHYLLKELSVWGGADARWVVNGYQYLGYEFPSSLWPRIVATLAHSGITFRVFDARRDNVSAGDNAHSMDAT